jgi:carbonic anhydrase
MVIVADVETSNGVIHVIDAVLLPSAEEAGAAMDQILATYVPSYSAEWSYEGETGPAFWGSLDPDYAACGEGMEQSPVDIVADAPVNPDDVGYAYGESALTIVNNGHAIQVNVDEGSSTAEIDGVQYALEQLHFHSPSEHTLAGENMAMEMHLVHHDADGNSAVFSALLVEGAENPAFASIWENMPAEEGDPVTIEGVVVNPDDLLPAERSYYHYMGSLTTPACTEGVTWHVLTTPVELSADQIAAFRTIHDGTNRPIQPMNDREFLGPDS